MAAKKDNFTIAFFDLDLNQIAYGSGDYRWPCPDACTRCGHNKVWGHGRVPTIIEGFVAALMIRRYRCPMCGCIIRLRPTGCFQRHQSDAATIRRTLAHRLVSGCWPPHRSVPVTGRVCWSMAGQTLIERSFATARSSSFVV